MFSSRTSAETGNMTPRQFVRIPHPSHAVFKFPNWGEVLKLQFDWYIILRSRFKYVDYDVWKYWSKDFFGKWINKWIYKHVAIRFRTALELHHSHWCDHSHWTDSIYQYFLVVNLTLFCYLNDSVIRLIQQFLKENSLPRTLATLQVLIK